MFNWKFFIRLLLLIPLIAIDFIANTYGSLPTQQINHPQDLLFGKTVTFIALKTNNESPIKLIAEVADQDKHNIRDHPVYFIHTE